MGTHKKTHQTRVSTEHDLSLAVPDRPLIHHGDARALSSRLPADAIQVTITSPPYFDLKDYGVPNQIGFGQSYEQYLDDLTLVFKNLHRATRDDGSLWIVIDTFRKEHEVLPLPFDLTAKLRSAGWILRDVVIWKKDRTLPWIHSGSTRKIFEYILVLSKSKNAYKYYADKLRDSSDLKGWWIRYPERYNPYGKSLEEIWTFDIPTQGSWGKKYIRHFCPLPEGLVRRIIELTTTEGDLVFDPFAGTGTVPTQAHRLGRRALGFELNGNYIAKFRSHLQTTKELDIAAQANAQEDFASLIINLRGLKFARTLLKKLRQRNGVDLPEHIVVRAKGSKPSKPHKLACFEYQLLFRTLPEAEYEEYLDEIVSQRPLSKYGIEPTFKLFRLTAARRKSLVASDLYCYSPTNTHHHKAKLTADLLDKPSFPILSPIELMVEDEDG
jgi:DNA modification methylase